MAVDLQEDKMIKEYIEEKVSGVVKDNSLKMKQKEIDDEFDNLDLNQFNDG